MRLAELDRKKRDLMLRKADILKAAEHIFAVKGYYQATMLDIAEEAQYAVGTLYLYFKDKQNLYINLLEEKMQKLICLVKEEVEQEENTSAKIKMLIETQLKFFVNNEDFFRIYFSERGGLGWTIKDKPSTSTVNLFFELLDYLVDLIKQAQLEGIIKADYHPQKVAYILLASINSIIIPWLRNSTREKEDILNQSSLILKVFLNGVGAK